jgi:excisionase family DNA binding protein
MHVVVLAQDAEPWSSFEEVDLRLGGARDTVYRWVEAKVLPAHRILKLWKLEFSEVNDWVRAGGANDAAARAKPARPVARGKK